MNVNDWVRAASNIDLGDGNDTLNIGNGVYNSTINMGAGNDTLNIKDAIDRTSINLGDGDDTIIIEKGGVIGSTEDEGAIDGGSGYDKLVLSNPESSINLTHLAFHANNIEEVDVSGGTNATTINVKLADVINLTDENNKLRITGDANDKVDFKDSGWEKVATTDDGYDAYTNSSNSSVTIEIKQGIDVDL
ncbi:hypothetical protein LMG8286_01732 [Campylobacter suis]|uniref:Uncharacterized protein n=1 Tax=Campylobacter suis TaxID=2790657 RepID=A0ABN7K9V4_9BACT|nr:hypothetical protein LMG8286_01732 [Campylobacter suis]